MAIDSCSTKLPPIAPGQVYGRLTAVEFVDRAFKNRPRWRFACSCGNEKIQYVNYVKNGNTSSCGCLKRERTQAMGLGRASHRMSFSPEYSAWKSMLDRCTRKANRRYADYGGRGIKVCDRWNDFAAFFSDMGNRPDDHSLDRIDNEGSYEPSNCRWATSKQQAANRRSQRPHKRSRKHVIFSEKWR